MGIQIHYIYEFILVMFCNAFNLERQLSNVSCVVEEFMVGLDFMGLFLLHIIYQSQISVTNYFKSANYLRTLCFIIVIMSYAYDNYQLTNVIIYILLRLFAYTHTQSTVCDY